MEEYFRELAKSGPGYVLLGFLVWHLITRIERALERNTSAIADLSGKIGELVIEHRK